LAEHKYKSSDVAATKIAKSTSDEKSRHRKKKVRDKGKGPEG